MGVGPGLRPLERTSAWAIFDPSLRDGIAAVSLSLEDGLVFGTLERVRIEFPDAPMRADDKRQR